MTDLNKDELIKELEEIVDCCHPTESKYLLELNEGPLTGVNAYAFATGVMAQKARGLLIKLGVEVEENHS